MDLYRRKLSALPVHVCQRLAPLTASKPLRCWPKCAGGTKRTELLVKVLKSRLTQGLSSTFGWLR